MSCRFLYSIWYNIINMYLFCLSYTEGCFIYVTDCCRQMWCTNCCAHRQSMCQSCFSPWFYISTSFHVKLVTYFFSIKLSFLFRFEKQYKSFYSPLIRFSAPLASTPIWARDFSSSEELITEFCRECRVVRKGNHFISPLHYFANPLIYIISIVQHMFLIPGLAGDLKKALKDGKPIIIEVLKHFILNV